MTQDQRGQSSHNVTAYYVLQSTHQSPIALNDTDQKENKANIDIEQEINEWFKLHQLIMVIIIELNNIL